MAAPLFPAAVRDESLANIPQSTSADEIHNGRAFLIYVNTEQKGAQAQTLVERLHGQSPQKNSVQQYTLFPAEVRLEKHTHPNGIVA